MNNDDSKHGELRDLLTRLSDSSQTEADTRRLNDLLRGDPEACELYLNHAARAANHPLLRPLLEQRPRHATPAPRERLVAGAVQFVFPAGDPRIRKQAPQFADHFRLRPERHDDAPFTARDLRAMPHLSVLPADTFHGVIGEGRSVKEIRLVARSPGVWRADHHWSKSAPHAPAPRDRARLPLRP